MTTRAGKILAGAVALVLAGPMASAGAQELSEQTVKSYMDLAWQLTPAQFSKPDGTVIQIDKKKREESMIPLDIARDVIMVGRNSALAQICGLMNEQIANVQSLRRREEARAKWTQQQLVFINQLHMATVVLRTGRLQLVETEEGKQPVVLEEDKAKAKPPETCSDEQRKLVKEKIVAFVAAAPPPKNAAAADAPAAKGEAPAKAAATAPAAGSTAKADATTTGSTTAPAAKAPPAPAAKPAPAPAAKAPAPAPEKK